MHQEKSTHIIPEEHYYWCIILIYFIVEASQGEHILGCTTYFKKYNTLYLLSYNNCDPIINKKITEIYLIVD